MKRKALFRLLFAGFCLNLALPLTTYATHNRAGEITYAFIAQNTVQATIATWTKASSILADRDSLQISWGDGTYTIVARVNGPPGGCCGVPSGVLLGNDIKYNLYLGTHTYPGVPPPPNNFYVLSMTDPNRNEYIINIANSVNVQFYIEDTIFFPANIQDVGYDHSPLCLHPPIDFAFVGDTFLHNPMAYDPDGDSISFRQIVPLQAQGLVVPGYKDPTIIPSPGPNNIETLNDSTGLYMWATPQEAAIYNVAFLISEYRRGKLLGTIDRDMQILVYDDTTSPPVVYIPNDTCVRAGDPLWVRVTGTDPNPSHTVTLTGYGGPLAHDETIFPDSLSPATFTNTLGDTLIAGNPALGIFKWQTVCLDIREQPWQFVFVAQNNNVYPKTDEKTWQVHVIPPPPLNLSASVSSNKKNIDLHWTNPYFCSKIHNFRGFSVWRRIGSNPFIPAYCETGLAGRGYTMIASGLYDTTFIDTHAIEGEDMCYRILAHFYDESPNGQYDYNYVVSVPSNETCIYLPYDVPVITTVSVLNTDPATGRMFVAWTKPKTGGTFLDTTIFGPSYRFDLYRSQGFNLTAPVLIQSFNGTTFSALSDTIYTDQGLNTRDSAYSYQVMFYADSLQDTVGATSQASSVYLGIAAMDTKLNLHWNFNVPWLQDSFQIFRQDFSSSGLFRYIATDTLSGSVNYIDTGLINDSTYCYFVRAYGHYTSSYIGSPLEDSSEIHCAIPVDTIPPCPPLVTVTNNCGIQLSNPCDTPFPFVNNLSWTVYPDSCDQNVVEYRIYYTPDTGGALTLIDSVQGIGNTTYQHHLSTGLAGCYVVTAVNRRGYESYKVNQVCIDDCPNYDLPNTFTPNNDGYNDYFTPVKCPPYRFITRVDLKIYTRWGEKVFETTNPQIMWDGRDQKTGKELSDGVYYYAGYYFEQTLHGEVRKPLPHKNGGGFIHLIRGT